MPSFASAAPLLVGAALAVFALAIVLWPLWRESVEPSAAPKRARRLAAEDDQRENPIEALREIEFDRATGKLSDTDYTALKSRYTQQALLEMRAADAAKMSATAPVASGSLDAAEAEILRHRLRRKGCATCGPRPEPDAIFCSNCGRYLSSTCTACGASVENGAARFCTSCGESFAAVA
jgi:hypothetical protein